MSVGGGHLLDATAIHHCDAVGHRQRLLLVVGDEDGRDSVVALEPLDLDLHVEPQVLVERAEGLIQQQHLGVDREAPRQRHALLLSARQLARQPLGEWTHMGKVQHSLDPRRNALARPVMRLEPVGDVLPDRHVGEQGVVLEHDADAAPVRRQVIDALAVEQDPSLRLPHEAGHDPQQRGFPAARRSEQGDQLAPADIEVDVADRDELPESVRDVVEAEPVARLVAHVTFPAGARGDLTRRRPRRTNTSPHW
jgi:hypothetical protein